jgi:hypothetical protein
MYLKELLSIIPYGESLFSGLSIVKLIYLRKDNFFQKSSQAINTSPS